LLPSCLSPSAVSIMCFKFRQITIILEAVIAVVVTSMQDIASETVLGIVHLLTAYPYRCCPVFYKFPVVTMVHSLQPHTERSSRSGSEPPSVEADVHVWHYALLVVRARKEEEDSIFLVQLSLSTVFL